MDTGVAIASASASSGAVSASSSSSSSSPSVCCICHGSFPSLFACCGCGLPLHARCYGAELTNEEQLNFTCDLCSYKVQSGSSTAPIRCVLCLRDRGPSTLFVRCGRDFLHALCQQMEQQIRTDDEMAGCDSANAGPCFSCAKTVGLRVLCSVPSCGHWLHPTCALQKGRVAKGGQQEKYKLYCPIHKAGQVKEIQPPPPAAPAVPAPVKKTVAASALAASRPPVKAAPPPDNRPPYSKAITMPPIVRAPASTPAPSSQPAPAPSPAFSSSLPKKRPPEPADARKIKQPSRPAAQAPAQKPLPFKSKPPSKPASAPAPARVPKPASAPASSDSDEPGAPKRIYSVQGWRVIQRSGEEAGGEGNPCQVCSDPWEYDNDAIMLCDGFDGTCKFLAHQTCNGEPAVVPEGDWMCALCTADQRMGTVKCAICLTNKLSPMKPVDELLGGFLCDRGPWAHITCALWTRGCGFTDDDRTRITGPDSFDRDFICRCDVCGGSGGYVNVCNYGDCQYRFHPNCGVREGLEMVNEYDQKENRYIKVYCKLHDPTDKFHVRRHLKESRQRVRRSRGAARSLAQLRDKLNEEGDSSPDEYDLANAANSKSQRQFPGQRREQRPSVHDKVSRVADLRNAAAAPLIKNIGYDKAELVDSAVWARLGDEPAEYKKQMIAIAENFSFNPALRSAYVSGALSADALAAMSNKDMASAELRQQRQRVQQQELAQSTADHVTTVRDPKTGQIRYFKNGSELTEEQLEQYDRQRAARP